jgi:hypothetical protein
MVKTMLTMPSWSNNKGGIMMVNKQKLTKSKRTECGKSPMVLEIEEKIELLSKLPSYAPKPVCQFTINGIKLVGRLEKKNKTDVFIRHHYGKKVMKYHLSEFEDVTIIHF